MEEEKAFAIGRDLDERNAGGVHELEARRRVLAVGCAMLSSEYDKDERENAL